MHDGARRGLLVACVLGSLVCTREGLSPGPRALELRVSPQIAFAPADVRVRVRVHAIASDRWVSVSLDSGDYRRVSSWSIEPDRTLYSWDWKSVPSGDYDVIAELGAGDAVRASDRQTVTIVAGGL